MIGISTSLSCCQLASVVVVSGSQLCSETLVVIDAVGNRPSCLTACGHWLALFPDPLQLCFLKHIFDL